MAKQHDLIAGRLIANCVAKLIERDDEGEIYHDDMRAMCGVLRLHSDDLALIEKSIKKKLKRLEKSSEPLGIRMIHWRDELAAI